MSTTYFDLDGRKHDFRALRVVIGLFEKEIITSFPFFFEDYLNLHYFETTIAKLINEATQKGVLLIVVPIFQGILLCELGWYIKLGSKKVRLLEERHISEMRSLYFRLFGFPVECVPSLKPCPVTKIRIISHLKHQDSTQEDDILATVLFELRVNDQDADLTVEYLYEHFQVGPSDSLILLKGDLSWSILKNVVPRTCKDCPVFFRHEEIDITTAIMCNK